MFAIMRKYQRVVFGFITAALILSVSFFGSYNAIMTKAPKEVDQEVGEALGGAKMTRLSLDRMSRFLATDQLDSELVHANQMPNFFNDGVIRKDFLESGLAQMLVEAYFEDLQEELATRLEVQKRFKPYVHPQAPFLSVESIWGQFMPSMMRHLQDIRTHDLHITPTYFKQATQLYSESSKFPPSLLRRFLSYQENQYQWIHKDPYLAQGDLSLFYFHKVEDWFGAKFIELISQFIENAALYATSTGYKVSYEEARLDLLKQGYEGIAAQVQEKITEEHIEKYWQELLHALRLTEKQAVQVWQKVLLFRKLFQDYGQSILMDKVSYRQYHNYVNQMREAKVYTLAEGVHLSDFRSFLKFQIYLETIAKDVKSARQLDLPQEYKPKEALKEDAPWMLERSYDVEMAHITKDQAAISVPLKDMWDWQCRDDSWNRLREQFKTLPQLKDKEARFLALERIKEEERSAIDQFSRAEMLKKHPEVVIKALQKVQPNKTTLHLSLKGKSLELEGIEHGEILITLFDQASVDSPEARKQLEFYTQDGENYYSFKVVSAAEEEKVLSFKEAVHRGVLEGVLESKLKEYHAKAQAAFPAQFQREDGSVKDFASVKNEIGAFIYKDLLELIAKDVFPEKSKGQRESLDFYATHRFYHFMKKAKADIEQNGDNSAYLDNKLFYFVVAKNEKVKRKEKASWAGDELFSMTERAYSPLHVAANGNISFYQVVNSSVDQGEVSIASQIEQGQELLAKDAKKQLMSELLEKIVAADAIHLTKSSNAALKEIGS